MPKNPEMSADQIGQAIQAGARQYRSLIRLQTTLTALCWIALIAAIAIKFTGGPSYLVSVLAMVGTVCGFGSWIAGRKAQPLYDRAQEIRKLLEQETAARMQGSQSAGTPKIPLTIGFANLTGAEFDAIASEDAAALSSLFSRSRVVAHHQIPSAEVLLVYAHLNGDGTIKGATSSGIRQLVQLTNATIVILASPNASASIQNAVALPGPKTANIVFTLDRNGNGFGRFFHELFEKMRDGKDMLSAWAELSPQNPNANPAYAPQTILLAEGGKIAFPR